MLIADLLDFLPLALAAVYLILLIILFVRRDDIQKAVPWLISFLAISAVWQLTTYLFPQTDGFLSPIPLKFILLGTLTLFFSSAVYTKYRVPLGWLFFGTGLIFLIGVLDFVFPSPLFVLPTRLQFLIRPTVGGILTFAFWLALSLLTYGLTVKAYRITFFPWHANRYLFWGNAVLVSLVGEALLLFDHLIPLALGHILRIIASIALVYAATAYIRFDVRTRFRAILAFLIIALFSAVPAAGIFLLFSWLRGSLTAVFTATIVIVITSLAFLFYRPYRRFIEGAIYRYLIGNEFQTSEIIRSYNQEVSRIVDVEQLSSAVFNTLSELFETSRGALMLVSQGDSHYEIEPIPALGSISRDKIELPIESSFIASLQVHSQPILQYEIDFNPDFRAVRHEMHNWQDSQEMELYAPIRSGTNLTGFFAIGPKSTGRTYQANEIELIQLMADQTVVALQNARLYTALGEQNEKVRHLNEGLRHQNDRLGVMDKVKSDFITIASHELRTPLTQVKGYADILAAMNEENALTRDQTRQIVGHINRATLRLEELITAMLDASQIDVDEMQMTFNQSEIDSVLRLAQEPLAGAIKQRRINLVTKGIDELPPIHADFKRLVQAFTNLLGNAIKYTPDGGKITLIGEQLGEGDEEFVQVSITDSGIGIDRQYHQLIFEKFFRIGDPQLHSTGSTKFMGAGPGLGLPIAKGVIEGHGGRIWVDSEGEDMERMPGSTFVVILPIRPPSMPNIIALKDLEKEERPAWLVG